MRQYPIIPQASKVGRGPSAYQPNALPLGQTVSQNRCMIMGLHIPHTPSAERLRNSVSDRVLWHHDMLSYGGKFLAALTLRWESFDTHRTRENQKCWANFPQVSGSRKTSRSRFNEVWTIQTLSCSKHVRTIITWNETISKNNAQNKIRPIVAVLADSAQSPLTSRLRSDRVSFEHCHRRRCYLTAKSDLIHRLKDRDSDWYSSVMVLYVHTNRKAY